MGGDTPKAIFDARCKAERQRREWEEALGVCSVPVQLEGKTGKDLVRHKSGYPGVTWEPWGECWRVQVTFTDAAKKTLNRNKRIRPADDSPKSVEQARLDAIEWHQTMLREGH